jgi:hypothetical protein
MFRNACTTAREYTRPVILCRQSANGQCSSSIGSYVIINEEGWIVTAGHIVDQLLKLKEEEDRTAASGQKDGVATPRSPETQENCASDATMRAGVNWGRTEAKLADTYRHPYVDLAIGRLEPFNRHSVGNFPMFKDPDNDFEPGASLCKYGFPFQSITPTWDARRKRFKLPADPLTMFPIEGIFTRTIIEDSVDYHYPLLYVETSSPGLRGQSGGPTFDVHGAIWAIQSDTDHLPLGFSPPVPDAQNGETEHQFLNVGRGVHSATLIGALTELGVRHTVSAF